MKISRKKLLACVLILCVNLGVIWGNSMVPGDLSGQMSQGVMAVLERIFRHPMFERLSSGFIELVNRMLGLTIPSDNVGGFLLRKAAHFAEFCWLGVNLCWLFRILEQKGIHRFTMPLLWGILAACVDETIQLYSPGRASSLADVWIDISGVFTGICLLLLVHNLIGKLKKRKKPKSSQ